MIRRSLQSIMLATTLLTAACSQQEILNVGDSISNKANDAVEVIAATVSSWVNPSSHFAVQVAYAGCTQSPYQNRSPIEILGLTVAFTGQAAIHYEKGIAAAKLALAGQTINQKRLLNDNFAFRGDKGLKAAFNGFNLIEAKTAEVRELEAKLQAASQAITPEMRKNLRIATAMLQIANHQQIHSAVGTALLTSYFTKAKDNGGSKRLLRILLQESRKHGVNNVMAEFSKSPNAMLEMFNNFGALYSLGLTMQDAVDYSTIEDASRGLGLDMQAELDRLQADALAIAASLQKSYPQQIQSEPTGQMVRTLISDYMQKRDYSADAIVLANGALSFTCSGVFDDDATVQANL